MDNEILDNQQIDDQEELTQHPAGKLTKLSGMYEDWFLDYASYVILERAVPHVYDGLKPVQRRILHSMKQLDDGRYNKVANIIGHTMQFHPHGDASIGDALVQLGQKELLIDTQGNWGNTLTGDRSAAPRYIEARLTKFALDVVFNPKTTNWKSSYDGRKKEPITLPIKFPLLLVQGVEGIAVGLASKILPHNFIEILDACINCLNNKPFELLPDFLKCGMADFSRYNDGMRGGKVRVRARIEKISNRELKITEIPYGETTTSVIDSIISANDKEKIKIKKIDDNTAADVEILISLPAGTSSDKTIDALYAFSKCEVSISPNTCVIDDNNPRLMGVSEILSLSVRNTVQLLKLELQIRQHELEEELHLSSLERWFIKEQIYKDKEYETAKTTEIALLHIGKRAEEIKDKLFREITEEDLLRLLEIRMKRIIRYSEKKAEEDVLKINEELEVVKYNIDNITDFAIKHYKRLKKTYGPGRERRTEICSFDNIQAQKVVIANEKLYVNFKEGFAGTGLKKEEYICDCSDIDEVIVFMKDGKYVVSKVSEKAFFGKNIIHIAVFKRNDKRTVFNAIYRDGKSGGIYTKRFAVTSVTRDKFYDLTQGSENSKILYFTANPNGEAEILKIYLKPKPKIRKLIFEYDFQELSIKGRQSKGNILTKHDIHKISLKEKGVSTLGGRHIYFDRDILRLNVDKRGDYIGEFQGGEKIIVFSKDGSYRLTSFDLSNHFGKNLIKIEKYNPNKIYTVIHFDGEHEQYYLKRFQAEDISTTQLFIGESENSKLIDLSEDKWPQIKIIYKGKDNQREDELIDAEEFIGLKGHKARGKRLTTFETKSIIFDTPLQKEEEEEEIIDITEEIQEIDKSDTEDDGEDDTNQMTLPL
jgi:topoisomerase-4 subunit A